MAWTPEHKQLMKAVALLDVQTRPEELDEALDALAISVANLPASPPTVAQRHRLYILARELRRRAAE